MSKVFVFHCPTQPFNEDVRNATIVSMNHPKHEGVRAKFAIINNELYEIQKTNAQTKSSWIIGDDVVSDGSLFIVTPYDATFLIIPLLEQARKATTENEKGFYCDQYQVFSNAPHLRTLKTEQHKPEHVLPLLCDEEQSGDAKMYRLNEEKVREWLRKKADNLISSLKQNKPFMDNLTKGRSTGKFRLSMKTAPSQDDEERQAAMVEEKVRVAAMQLLSGYLSNKWTQVLASLYQYEEGKLVPSAVSAPPPTSSSSSHSYKNLSQAVAEYNVAFDDPPNAKKRKRGDDDEDTKPKKKVATISRSAASLAKVDTSKMKSITSFFKKKE